MALVAYDNSDGSSNSGIEDNDTVVSRKNVVKHTKKSSFAGAIEAAGVDLQFEDELEDIVKPSENELAMRQEVAKKRKPVKIMLPSLSQMDSDSDDESDVKHNSKKVKTAPASGKCGLFSMLPPPVIGAKLLPHKLTQPTAIPQQKKLPAVSPVNIPQKKVPVSSSVELLQKKVPVVSSESSLAGVSTSFDSSIIEDNEDDSGNSFDFFALDSESLPVNSYLPRKLLHVSDSTATSDASIDLDGSNVLPDKSHHYAADDYNVQHDQVDSVHKPETTFNDTYHYEADEYNAQGHTSSTSMSANYGDVDDEVPESSSGFENCLQDEQFLRLCGRKHKQAVNIIDVHADDQLRDVDLTKSISEETQNLMSHSKKRNKDMPSSQQKRKHQITYLAFKAKERELDLKNQWAENKFNKRQTQSKYGF